MSAPAHVVFVVEDDAAVREAICEVLEDHGYMSRGAANGREALEQLHFAPAKPCLILLDIMMPVMDGREFRALQRSDPHVGDVPVVVLSAHANVDETARSMDVAAALRKPVRLDALLELVRRFCDPHAAPSSPGS